MKGELSKSDAGTSSLDLLRTTDKHRRLLEEVSMGRFIDALFWKKTSSKMVHYGKFWQCQKRLVEGKRRSICVEGNGRCENLSLSTRTLDNWFDQLEVCLLS